MSLTATPPTAEQRANTAFHRVMETAPMGLLLSAALGLLIVGVFQYIFYLGVLPAGWTPTLRATLSTGLAAFFEGLGFYFLVATVRDFSAGHRREGYIGLLATCLLWAYALWEAHHISAAFDQGGKYWAIMGIIGTIVCVVRVVELRITLTVTSAYLRADALSVAESALSDYRKEVSELTGKVNRYEAEKREQEDRKQAEAERLAALEAEEAQRQQAEKWTAMEKELAAAKRALSAADKNTTGKDTINPDTVRRTAADFMRKNRGVKVSQKIAAQILNKDERTIRNAFKNGSWDAMVAELFQEINQTPETTTLS